MAALFDLKTISDFIEKISGGLLSSPNSTGGSIIQSTQPPQQDQEAVTQAWAQFEASKKMVQEHTSLVAKMKAREEQEEQSEIEQELEDTVEMEARIKEIQKAAPQVELTEPLLKDEALQGKRTFTTSHNPDQNKLRKPTAAPENETEESAKAKSSNSRGIPTPKPK